MQATHRLNPNLYIDRSAIPWFINTSWIVMIVAAILQLTFWGTLENLFATVCVFVAWYLTVNYLLRFNRLRRFAFSSFLILGFSFTQYFMPLVFTLLEGKPLVYNLQLPYDVFTHSLLALLTLLCTHAIYTQIQTGNSPVRKKIQGWFSQLSIYRPPSDRQIWIMGFIGIVSLFYIYFIVKAGGADKGGASNKFVQGLIPFSYLPFFLPLQRLYRTRSFKLTRTQAYQLIGYTILLFLVSLGRNSRSSFMLGFTAVGLGYFIGILLGKFNYRIFTPKKLILGVLLFWVVTGPLSDLGIAMVAVRTHRGRISSEDLLVKTIETYQDKDALRRYKMQIDEREKAGWDEHYFDNIFLSRFCNIKYNDASLVQVSKLKGVDEKMREYSIDVVWSTLPQPVLTLFDINVNKKAVTSGSFGDYLYHRATGSPIGGFRTGQFAGTGMAAFGWWYLLLLAIGSHIVFFLLDIFVVYNRDPAKSYLSVVGLSSITTIFMFLSLSSHSESVMNLYTYALRGWIQLVFMYAIVFYVARRIDIFLQKKIEP